ISAGQHEAAGIQLEPATGFSRVRVGLGGHADLPVEVRPRAAPTVARQGDLRALCDAITLLCVLGRELAEMGEEQDGSGPDLQHHVVLACLGVIAAPRDAPPLRSENWRPDIAADVNGAVKVPLLNGMAECERPSSAQTSSVGSEKQRRLEVVVANEVLRDLVSGDRRKQA